MTKTKTETTTVCARRRMVLHVCAVWPEDSRDPPRSWLMGYTQSLKPSTLLHFFCRNDMAHFKAQTAAFWLERPRFELSFSSGPTGIWKWERWERKLCPPCDTACAHTPALNLTTPTTNLPRAGGGKSEQKTSETLKCSRLPTPWG